VDAGSVGQFLVVVAHPELGISNTAKRRTASDRPEFDENRFRVLLRA